jgi:thioredoxin-related protein
MKKLIVLVSILFIGLTAFSQEEKVNWYSFEKAVSLNEKDPRIILIDVYTDWCGWCTKMKKTTFNHPEIAEYINENFYAVRFNAESNKTITFEGQTFVKQGERKKSPHQLAIALLQGKMSYPSVAYLNKKNQLITTVPGYYGPKDMEPILKYFAEEIYKKKNFKEFQKNFQNSLVKE